MLSSIKHLDGIAPGQNELGDCCSSSVYVSVHGEPNRLGKAVICNKGIKLHEGRQNGNTGMCKEELPNTENYTFLYLSLQAVYWPRTLAFKTAFEAAQAVVTWE